MGLLKLGIVGLDIELTDAVSGVQQRSRDGNITVTITGYLNDTTIANRDAIRRELIAQTGRFVAVTWDQDDDIDGFYIQRSADIRGSVRDKSYSSDGTFIFTTTIDRLGLVGETEIQTNITGTVLTNSHGLIESECKPFHAPAGNHLAYNAGAGTPTQRSRTGDEGAINWYDDIDTDNDPTWSIEPADMDTGAARIYVSGRRRTSTAAPNNVDDFELSNSLVKLTPGTTTGSSNGRFDISWYDGSQWDTALRFKIVHNADVSPSVIPAWHYLSILRVDQAVCSLRLIRDAAPATSPHRHVIDISLRRGSRMVYFYYTWTGNYTTTDDIIRETADACATVTPTGASSAVGVLDSVATDGNKWCMFTAKTHTARTTEGGVRITNPTYDFAIGAEIGTPGTGDAAADMALQYFGWVAERDEPARR
jgi:hypothetical protein